MLLLRLTVAPNICAAGMVFEEFSPLLTYCSPVDSKALFTVSPTETCTGGKKNLFGEANLPGSYRHPPLLQKMYSQLVFLKLNFKYLEPCKFTCTC